MYQTKVLTTKDSNKWMELLEKVEHPDIYFTPEYAKIYEHNYSEEINEAFCGTSLLFFFGDEKEFVIYPFIKRNINELPFMQQTDMPQMFDVITHYGYTGPIIQCEEQKNKKILTKKFLDAFSRYCSENNIITEFIRFNPLLNNHSYLEEFISIDKRNNTVFIDLTQDEQTILMNMNKKTRNLVRKAEKNNIEVKNSKNKEDLKIFTNLYLQTMDRNEADEKYFFSFDFFEKTFDLLKDNISLFTARYEDKIIAASLFLHKYDFIHYHFSGSDRKYVSLAPNNLILWKAALWGKKQGYKKFHLGGGSSNEDRLYHFKSGFSNTQSTFYTSSITQNASIYNDLCKVKENFETKKGKHFITSDFFPNYRKIIRE